MTLGDLLMDYRAERSARGAFWSPAWLLRHTQLLGHAWTCILLAAAGLFCVILPWNAIVRNNWLFGIVVVLGLVISFICAAAETAFPLACGEDFTSPKYRENITKLEAARRIAESPDRSPEIRASARRRLQRLDTFQRLTSEMKGRYNPMLVVVNNVAIILVTVLSGMAQFSEPAMEGSHDVCRFASGHAGEHHFLGIIAQLSPAVRCVGIGSHIMLPFPVNVDLFQSAFAFTLILVAGEIAPKQLAYAFPALMTEKLLWWVQALSCLSLGTARSFGVFGLQLSRLIGKRSGGLRAPKKPRAR